MSDSQDMILGRDEVNCRHARILVTYQRYQLKHLRHRQSINTTQREEVLVLRMNHPKPLLRGSSLHTS